MVKIKPQDAAPRGRGGGKGMRHTRDALKKVLFKSRRKTILRDSVNLFPCFGSLVI